MTLENQKILNVFTYQDTNGAGTAADLLGEFDARVLGEFQPLVTDTLSFDEIEVINLDDPSDFIVDTNLINESGDNINDPMPSYVAVSIRLTRPTTSVRNGYKRIAGITENQSLGSSIGPSSLTAWQAAADVMYSFPNAEATEVYQIVYRAKDKNTGLTSYVVPSGTLVQPLLTTQTSRKIGRGQ